MVIEVGGLWGSLVLLEVVSMSYVLLPLSLSMFAVAQDIQLLNYNVHTTGCMHIVCE